MEPSFKYTVSQTTAMIKYTSFYFLSVSQKHFQTTIYTAVQFFILFFLNEDVSFAHQDCIEIL